MSATVDSNKTLTAALRVLDRPIATIYRADPEEWSLGGTLRLCVCGAPSFSQPCATCGYYPMGRDDAEFERCAGRATRDGFVRAVNRAGNIAAWFFADKRSTVAYRENPVFVAAVESAVEQTKSMEWPSPGRIWDAFASQRVLQAQEQMAWRDAIAMREKNKAARVRALINDS